MRFLCPISGNGAFPGFYHSSLVCIEPKVDPLFGFAFLQTFIDILHEYFGNLSAATLKDNFDVVYQV
jgi:AP-3 complex subunit mu